LFNFRCLGVAVQNVIKKGFFGEDYVCSVSTNDSLSYDLWRSFYYSYFCQLLIQGRHDTFYIILLYVCLLNWTIIQEVNSKHPLLCKKLHFGGGKKWPNCHILIKNFRYSVSMILICFFNLCCTVSLFILLKSIKLFF